MQSGGLTKKQGQAALWLAEGQLAEESVAQRLRVNPATLWRWKHQPAFAARVEEHKARWATELEQEGIANRQNRVDALNARWRLMQRVIAERAADPTMKAPGSGTGLLVRTYKPGKYKTIEEYRFDASLLAELRAHELQAARELGQIVDKHEHTGRDGGPIEERRVLEVVAVDYRVGLQPLRPVALPDPEDAA